MMSRVSVKYSTGPVENAINITTLPGESRMFFVKVLNNGHRTAAVEIKLFRLNGEKELVERRFFRLDPGSSTFRILNVSGLAQFEVQIKTNSKKVLVSAWGKDDDGRLVAAHRFTPEELVRKEC